ncbi:winged helix-turn-helix domain-containing protein [Natronoglomus mannanivorans]|uniref:Winged helix-turn-helix domain-containing protein n=1 Tax=Natronoglomus mannanivorans TaxID=2979990 RepID=A0AAP2Z0L5_9EURY|nr:winged helix-turn-helix domain-containing protein [Halobacteria archaeon AArc-xg1-1]
MTTEDRGHERDVGRDAEHVEQAVIDSIGALGNRQRLEILLALAEAEWDHRTNGYVLSFTELYDAVEGTSTSQFSYHLEKLVGRFVDETEDGYRLTDTGGRLVRAIFSGVYERPSAFEPVDLEGACLACDSTALVGACRDDGFVVTCADCEATLVTDYLPRSQTRSRTPAEIAESTGCRIWSTVVLVRGGVCPECYSRVDSTVESAELGDRSFYTSASTCRECRFTIHLPVEVPVAFHPAAIGFCWEHDISLFDVPIWELFGSIQSGTLSTTVLSESPFEATVEISRGGETLALEVDDSLTVRAVERLER